MSAKPIPLAKLLELQALLQEAARAIDYPPGYTGLETCLRSRLNRMSGVMQYYVEEAIFGIVVPIAAEVEQ